MKHVGNVGKPGAKWRKQTPTCISEETVLLDYIAEEHVVAKEEERCGIRHLY